MVPTQTNDSQTVTYYCKVHEHLQCSTLEHLQTKILNKALVILFLFNKRFVNERIISMELYIHSYVYGTALIENNKLYSFT